MCYNFRTSDEHQVTLRKNPEGLGIHLSVGPPPVLVTLVELGTYNYRKLNVYSHS